MPFYVIVDLGGSEDDPDDTYIQIHEDVFENRELAKECAADLAHRWVGKQVTIAETVIVVTAEPGPLTIIEHAAIPPTRN